MILTNHEEILRALRLCHPNDEPDWVPEGTLPSPPPVIEIRHRYRKADGSERVVGKRFRSVEAAARHAEEVSERDSTVAVWHNLNLIDQGATIEKLICDNHVARRTHLLIDFDTIRPDDTNATEKELQAAIETMQQVRADLQDAGWFGPMVIMSGNGIQLIYAIDEPASSNIVSRVLEGLAKRYSTDKVKIDTSVINRARMTKLPGTAARKAPHTPDRPHRMATILDAPERLISVPTACLEQVAMPESAVAETKWEPASQAKVFNVGEWLEENDVPYRVHEKEGKHYYEVPCPWKAGARTTGGACIAQDTEGAVTAWCHHDSCKERNWSDFRQKIDPHWKEPQRCPTAKTVKDAEYLARRHLETTPPAYLYRGEVYYYIGGVWRPQDTDDVKIGIRRTLMQVFGEYRQRENKAPSVTESLTNNVLGCFRSILSQIPSEYDMPCWIDGRQVNVLVVANGILDLDTGEIRRHTKRLFSQFKLPYDYDPAATCPRFEAAMQLIFDDQDEIRLAQEIFGATLRGGNDLRAIWLFQGATHGGKGVLTSVLCHLVGKDNYTSIRPGKFSGQFALWNARGKLLIVVPDINGKRPLPPAFVEAAKIISGGDPIDIDGKNRHAVCEVLPAKLLLVSNDILQMEDDSAALYTRFIPLKFVHHFFPEGHRLHEPSRAADPSLEKALKKELPGILNWSLIGLRRLKSSKFTMPAASQTLCEILESEGSPLLDFARECLTIGGQALCAEVYKAYWCWCTAEGIEEKERMSQKQFGRALRTAFPKIIRKREPGGDRRWFYEGICLTQ